MKILYFLFICICTSTNAASNETIYCTPIKETNEGMMDKMKVMFMSLLGPVAGTLLASLLISFVQVVIQRLVPYLRSGVISQIISRTITDRRNPFYDILPEGMPHDMYQSILDISRHLYRNSMSTKPIAEGFEYITHAYIYRLRLKLKKEQISNVCTIVQDTENLGFHEFHHKVLSEMRKNIELLNSKIAENLARWIEEGRVTNYTCNDTMVYLLHTGNVAKREVILEVLVNPIMDPVHNANIRRHITGGVGSYSHYEPPVI